MSMLANKIKWVRAAVIYNEQTAISAKEHNNANVLCLGGCQATPEELLQWVKIFFSSDFLWGRYQERIDKLEAVME
jgi:ribose 5-phosphate isomerase B